MMVLIASLFVVFNADIPHKGDQMAIVFRNDNSLYAIDQTGGRDEADGSRSVVTLMMKRKEDGHIIRIAGRLAFKCHSHQWRVMSRYLLDDNGQVIESDSTALPYDELDPNSVAALAYEYVCSNITTADTAL